MNKPARSKAQVGRDKKALRSLAKSGLYTGKLDLRRAPTRYQQRLIKRYADVLSGKAVVVRPADPKRYIGTFKTAPRGAVIVPRAKGEKIGLSKTGRITRKRPGKKPRTIIPVKREPEAIPAPPTGTAPIFWLPFGRGKGGETYWRAFSRASLVRFFAEYKRTPTQLRDWLRYLEIEDGSPEYERQLDRIISGDVGGSPTDPIPHTSRRYRSGKRAIKREVLDEYGESEG